MMTLYFPRHRRLHPNASYYSAIKVADCLFQLTLSATVDHHRCSHFERLHLPTFLGSHSSLDFKVYYFALILVRCA